MEIPVCDIMDYEVPDPSIGFNAIIEIQLPEKEMNKLIYFCEHNAVLEPQ